MRIKIYQIKSLDDKKKFNSVEDSSTIDVNIYEKVYDGELNLPEDTSITEILEEVYFVFNMQHPKGFCGHSLSVSDVVTFDNKAYVCNSFGWGNVTDRYYEFEELV